MSEKECPEELDLFWHALNYRTAATSEAEAMWQELQKCVDRLIAQERERCAALCDSVTELYRFGSDDAAYGSEHCAREIRASCSS